MVQTMRVSHLFRCFRILFTFSKSQQLNNQNLFTLFFFVNCGLQDVDNRGGLLESGIIAPNILISYNVF